MPGVAQVLAGGVLIPLDAYEAAPTDFVEALARARGEHGHAACLCTTPHPPLVIRRRTAPEGDWFLLATWPNHGTAHAPGCRFHHSEADYAAARAQRLAAAQVGADGFSVKPDFSLALRLVPASPPQPREQAAVARGPKTQRATMGLLGLLEFLWGQAGLHRHAGGAGRLWGEVQSRLLQAGSRGRLGEHKLADRLFVVPPFDVARKALLDAQWKGFVARFVRGKDAVPLFLVLGEIKATARAGRSVGTDLRHFAHRLFMSFSLATELARRYPAVEARLGQSSPDGRAMGLYLVEVSDRGNLWVHDAALMLVSRDYLPADSSHEARLADALVDARRVFEKPLTAPADRPLPDFVLHDTQPATVMEVWGMATDAYQLRKQEKLQAYAAAGMPVWEWDAVKQAEIPVLPAASGP